MSEWPTAREQMDSGKWIHRRYIAKGIAGLHFYTEKLSDTRYRIVRMDCLSGKGLLVTIPLSIICKALRFLFNAIRKELGDAVFNELLNEIQEARLAKNHRLSTGRAYGLGNSYNSSEECDEVIQKEVDKLLKEDE